MFPGQTLCQPIDKTSYSTQIELKIIGILAEHKAVRPTDAHFDVLVNRLYTQSLALLSGIDEVTPFWMQQQIKKMVFRGYGLSPEFKLGFKYAADQLARAPPVSERKKILPRPDYVPYQPSSSAVVFTSNDNNPVRATLSYDGQNTTSPKRFYPKNRFSGTNPSDFENKIARMLVDFGASHPSDQSFTPMVQRLRDQAINFLPDTSSITREWIEERLQIMMIIDEVNDPMLRAAFDSAANRLSSEVSNLPTSYLNNGTIEDQVDGTHLQTVGMGMALDAATAAARASDLPVLNRAEIEYNVSEGGINQFSALSVQPLYESDDLAHNVFVQGSYMHRDNRDTGNLGIGYRYMTPDEKALYGANLFVDHEWPYNHSRIGVGVDYKTSLLGIHANHYFAISDWKERDDGFDEKAMSGSDILLSGRIPHKPNIELFVRGYHWDREKTPILNPNGKDIWGYETFVEYTPINAMTLRAGMRNDNDSDDVQADIGLRLNYNFGMDAKDLLRAPTYNLESVKDRRFDKVQRINEIRVQERQRPGITAFVVFAQGANVEQGTTLPFGSRVTTGGAGGDAVTIRFGDGAVLNLGSNSAVLIESDRITLESGTLQYVSGSGGITNLVAPGQMITLLGTDVDLSTNGGSTILRVRDGAADFTDEAGTTRLTVGTSAESRSDDGIPPQILNANNLTAQNHSRQIHNDIHLAVPNKDTAKSSAYSDRDTIITGTMAVGETITFSVPVTKTVIVSGSPQLTFDFGGQQRFASYNTGSGTNQLIFIYQITGADGGLSNIEAREIQLNGGSVMGTNNAPMVPSLSGTMNGTIASDTIPNPFTFTDQTDVAVNTAITSDTITIAGLNASAAISITGDGTPQYSINGGAFTSVAGTINNGDTVTLQLTSAATGSVMRSATLDIGGVTDQWDVTTLSDTAPDAFAFTDQTDVAVNTAITSNTITIAGLNAAAAISITGDGTPQYSINGGAFTSVAGTINNGDTVALRLTSAATGGVMRSATLDIGGITDQWDVTTLSDTAPDAFAFTDQTNVAVNTAITSNTITIAGLNASAAISITGDGTPQYSINGGAFTSVAGTINNGDTVALRLTSAATGGVMRSATLDIGGITDQWDVTTLSDTAPDAFAFTDQTDVAVNTAITSNTITIAGLNAAAAISITGDGTPQYSINGGAFTSVAGTINNGDTVALRLTSAATGGVMRSATLDIGGVTDQWDVTTLSDTAPDAFAFTDQTDVAVNTAITSDTITIAGLNASAAISITGDGTPQYSINGGAYTSVAGTINNGDTVTLQLTSAATGSVMRSATLDIGGVTDQWDVTTLSDTAPDAFAFTDQTDVAVNTAITSDTITIAGLNASAAISITGDGTPQYSINGGAFTSVAGTINNGDTVALRLTSAATGSVMRSATLDIGGVTDQWDVTTLSDTAPDAFAFTDQTDVAVNTAITSDTITIAGLNASAAISITGDGTPQYSINGGAFTSVAGTINNGDTVALRLTSAPTGGVMRSATLDIGGITDQWDVTTLSDTAPDAFAFTDQTDVAVNTAITSDTITIAGLNASAAISITGDGTPQYSINGGAFTSVAGTINNGDTVALRLTSAATGGVMRSATLDIGGVTDQWDVTTLSDTAPDAFAFTDQTDVAVNTAITSDTITIAGLNASAAISITGDGTPQYSINGGAFTSVAGTINNGDTVALRLTSAATGGVMRSATLDIGGITDQWDVTTLSDTAPDAFAFTDQTDVAVNTAITSNTITIAGLNASAAISITGDGTPQYSINGGAFTSMAGTINNGDTVALRLTSAATGGVMRSATLDIGGITDQWDVRSINACPVPQQAGDEGCTMPDGSIYAGEFSGAPLYTSASDQGQFAWNNGTTNYTVTGATSLTDGMSNTNLLVALNDAGAPYQAAEACRALGADWYLPSRDELNLLRTNRSAIGGFDYENSYYWSSTEGAIDKAFRMRISSTGSSGILNGGKNDTRPVRCVRRAAGYPAADTTPNAFTFTDQTDVAANTLITSNTITINGIAAPTLVTISGQGSPEFRINGGDWVTSAGINSGQTLQVRMTSGGAGVTHAATVTVGGVNDIWQVSVTPPSISISEMGITDNTLQNALVSALGSQSEWIECNNSSSYIASNCSGYASTILVSQLSNGVTVGYYFNEDAANFVNLETWYNSQGFVFTSVAGRSGIYNQSGNSNPAGNTSTLRTYRGHAISALYNGGSSCFISNGAWSPGWNICDNGTEDSNYSNSTTIYGRNRVK
ncbi:Attaching and effacing protein [Phaeobacter inhibens]|uniref:Attaching and effacing protein n=1 Tax=Phaeobacter inhibens TaxID=221822 RepID=A0ABM6RIW1_9RHOB|nr:inverse autotransporter beta domain-containing protein [Phaeobacter inhibens]AUQ50906.1 Attaching and effacing protein [Phaeobacter inhibens]AUQ96448.1 Attaching and effacing protein [Phaeobacter inhibens]AUR20711.1 Attaching and effacing protein [Phaeobacter inhibens]